MIGYAMLAGGFVGICHLILVGAHPGVEADGLKRAPDVALRPLADRVHTRDANTKHSIRERWQPIFRDRGT